MLLISRKTSLLLALLVALTAAMAWYASRHPMDFRVYHVSAHTVFDGDVNNVFVDGTRPMYGVWSGMGWPMHYRYPPLFLLLFAPFAWIPIGAAAALWVSLKVVVLVLFIRALIKRLPPAQGVSTWLVPLLLAGPYVIQDFRYGNAQFFVFALTALSLLMAREKPVLSAASLALGIVIKVWPLFFIPYLLARRDWKVAVGTLLIAAILMAVPSAYFGVDGNIRLVREWFNQEFATQSSQEEIWFPSQSLRGVMMRYLTAIDYSHLPDSNYRLVNVATVNPRFVRMAWLATSVIIYAAFIWWVSRRRRQGGWIDVGLAFCLLSLLEPFTQKYAMVVLLWPAIVAGRSIDIPAVRNLCYLSIGLAVILPLIPGSEAQRFMQVLGMDFAAATALAMAMTCCGRKQPRPMPQVTGTSAGKSA